MPDLSIRDCLNQAQAQLETIENPGQCALVLMAHVLQREKTWVLAHHETKLNTSKKEAFFDLTNRLTSGVPLPYLTGSQSFFGLDFMVNPNVLIPRPETEQLVEEALSWLHDVPGTQHALDVGTGSGCIAISLLKNAPGLRVSALDISEKALETARENARAHGVFDRISFQLADLLTGFHKHAGLICANLPYIPSAKFHQLTNLKSEPELALDGGEDGLALIRRLLAQSRAVLNTPGLILLEIEETTAAPALTVARQQYPRADIRVLKDLADKNRLLRIEVSS